MERKRNHNNDGDRVNQLLTSQLVGSISSEFAVASLAADCSLNINNDSDCQCSNGPPLSNLRPKATIWTIGERK